jgi:hypothetical protein
MKNLLAIAGAAAFAFAGPAYAKPGHGHGNNSHAAHQSGKAKRGVVVSDRYGRLYALNARGTCPPGLAKKGNGCMPPGQAKKQYNVGQRYNRNFGTTWSYNQIPDYLRDQYRFDPNDRYYYRNGYVYQVDPRTMLVEQVISALLR